MKPYAFRITSYSLLMLIALAFTASSNTALSASVGINFHGGRNEDAAAGASVSGVAGAPGYSQGSWNNLAIPPDAASGSAVNLVDSTGVPTGVSVSWTADGTYDTGIPMLTENDRLMRGHLDVFEESSGTIGVTGINYESYDVVIYFEGANRDENQGMSFSIGSETIFARDAANVNFSGTFVQVPGTSTTDLGTSTPSGNYVVFESLGNDSFVLSAVAGTTTGRFGRARINGLQIFAIVPEPKSQALAMFGAAVLVGVAVLPRKRRCVQRAH